MEQFINENITEIMPVTLLFVWLAIEVIRWYFPAKFIYYAEVVVLSANSICNILFALVTAVNMESPEEPIISVTWALACIGLIWLVMGDYYQRRHDKRKKMS